MALQFPDFDPVLVTVPGVHVGWLGASPAVVASGGLVLAGVAALTWRARRIKAAGGDPEDKEGRVADLAWNALRAVILISAVAFVLHFVVAAYNLDFVGPFPVRWYALAYIAGIMIGWGYALSLVKNAKLWGGRPATLSRPQLDDLIFWITLAIIVGGRAGYVLFYMLVNPDQRAGLFAHPTVIFEIWTGGMSFHGAMIGVGLAMVVYAIVNRLPLLGIADLVAACEPIGQGFGRLANFVNGELWGRPTDLPWGMIFCNHHIAAANGGACPREVLIARHPSQLYEAGLEGLVLFLVLRWATHGLKWLPRQGAVTGLWLVGYGAIRIALENVRNPDDGMPNFPFGLTMGMMLSIPMILVGLFLLWRAFRQAPPAPTATAQGA